MLQNPLTTSLEDLVQEAGQLGIKVESLKVSDLPETQAAQSARMLAQELAAKLLHAASEALRLCGELDTKPKFPPPAGRPV